MPEPLNVVPADLHLSAGFLDMHRSALLDVHGLANANIEESLGGWVGESAKAMKAKLESLTDIDNQVADELERHDDLCRHAAYNFHNLDDGVMAAFIRAERA